MAVLPIKPSHEDLATDVVKLLKCIFILSIP